MRRALTMLCFALPLAASAQEAPSDAAADELRIEDGAFVIEGEVQKPEVVVVVTRESVEQGFELELDEDFLHKIVDALEQEPF